MAKFKDIYTKLPSDINYIPIIETDDETQIILQQIKMILGTTPTEVLGSPTLGINLKQYLFSYTLDTNAVRKHIAEHLSKYVYFDPQKYQVDIDVKYGKDSDNGSDYALIDVTINQIKILGIIVNQ